MVLTAAAITPPFFIVLHYTLFMQLPGKVTNIAKYVFKDDFLCVSFSIICATSDSTNDQKILKT